MPEKEASQRWALKVPRAHGEPSKTSARQWCRAALQIGAGPGRSLFDPFTREFDRTSKPPKLLNPPGKTGFGVGVNDPWVVAVRLGFDDDVKFAVGRRSL